MQVYRFILLMKYHYQTQRDARGIPKVCKREFAILRTCTQIYNEAIEVWRYENIWVHTQVPATVVRLLKFDHIRNVSQIGIAATTPPTLSIRLECPRWKDDEVYTMLELPENLDIVR